MSLCSGYRALAAIDARCVSRDAMLRWMIVLPVALVLVLRWGTPACAAWLEARFAFGLPPYYPLLMSFALLMTPGLFGMVIGFLLLDQRDDRTMSALLVTPLTPRRYLTYRLALPMIMSVLVTLAVLPLAGLVETGPLAVLVPAVAAAPLAPIYALFLAGFARNKVQGFALCKAAGVLFVPVIVAWFVDPVWQVLCGLVPLFWPMKAYWLLHGAGDGPAWPWALVGLLWQAALLVLLVRRFERVCREES